MKKRLFTVITVVVIALSLLAFVGCNGYTSHYSSAGLVQTKTTKKASVSFYSLKGTMVYTLKCGSEDEQINYSANLEEGSATVYYDSNGEKTELFSVNSGDDISDVGGVLQKGTVYIIIETSSACQNGSFSFEIK